MKNFIYIVLGIIIFSCSTKQLSLNQIEGKYTWNGVSDHGETLELRSDSTFIFEWTQGLITGKTSGKIGCFDNHFCLVSEPEQDIEKFTIEVPPQTKQDYYEIMVRDNNWNRFSGATCVAYLNGELIQGQSTNKRGICQIESLEIDSIAISYAGYNNAIIPIEKTKTPKSLIVRLTKENYDQQFENLKLKIINKNTIELETVGIKRILKKIKTKA